MLNQGTINEYKVNSPVIKRTPRSPAHFIVNVTGIKHQVPMDIRVGLRQKPTFPVLALVGVRHITYYPMIIGILIRTDPVLVILDRDRKIRASLPGVAWNYTRRINEATDISLSVPRQVVDEYIPPGHDLEDFFRKNKAQYAEIASFIQVFSGSTLKASGKIARRTLGELVEIQAFTEEILLEGNLTPAQYGKVYDGWDLAYVARDILDGWQSIRVKDKSQWQAYMADSSDVDLDTEPGVVMLAKSGGQYRPSGYITLQFDSGEVRDFLRWDRIRWSADSEDPVKTTIQYSTNGTSWSSEFDGGIPEEVGIVPSNATSDSMYIRINLYTDDTESEDPDGNPVGVTPFVFAVELIARTEGDLVEGNIPATSGVVVKGIDADHASAFQVLLSACEQAGWEFQVVNGALSIAESLGADRTKDFVLRAGTNMEITSLGDDDEELCNVLTAYSPGRGINRMELTLRDDVSVAEFGEYPKAVEFEAETLTELQNKAEEYLEEHSNPKTNFEVFATFDFEHEPEYGLGDKVRVADPDTGIVTATRIMSETRQFGDNGLSVRLELGKAGLNLQTALDGRDRIPKPLDPLTPTGVYARGIVTGIVVGCSTPKGDWETTECHVSTAKNFIPSAGTLRATGKQIRFDIMELEPGVRYYARLIHIDHAGRQSEPSREVSASAQYVPIEHLPDHSIGVDKFMEGIKAPIMVTSKPNFPDPRYPLDTILFYTVDSRLYRVIADDWEPLSAGKLVLDELMAGIIEAGGITADYISSVYGLNVDNRVQLGNIGGRAWGEGTLPANTYGLWGEGAGLYLRGYANTMLVGYAQDEDIIDLSPYNPANPQIVVAPKNMLTYSPQQKDAVPVIFTDAVDEGNGKFSIKAKTQIRGAYSPFSTSITSGNQRSGSWQQPQTAAPNGNKGVDTNFFQCRVNWFTSQAYTVNIYQYVTNEFNASGSPINWKQKRKFTHQGPLLSSHSGTLNWDIVVPQGQWAIRVTWSNSNPVLTDCALTSIASAGYRSDIYLNMDGNSVSSNTSSGMDVMFYAFDIG